MNQIIFEWKKCVIGHITNTAFYEECLTEGVIRLADHNSSIPLNTLLLIILFRCTYLLYIYFFNFFSIFSDFTISSDGDSVVYKRCPGGGVSLKYKGHTTIILNHMKHKHPPTAITNSQTEEQKNTLKKSFIKAFHLSKAKMNPPWLVY